MPEVAYSQLAELKIPARDEYIGIAKRVATSLGGQLGFGLDEIDELAIAVVQACTNVIEAAEEAWGGGATIKVTFSPTDRGLAVDVEAIAPGAHEALPVQRAIPEIRAPSSRALPPAASAELEEATRALARDMIRLFVDDFRHQVDAGSRHIRYRMVKYLIS
ncbi:MAG TPA: ATP-binding protein [Candidatus Dormibacteraeota bacterium]|nr:ATP-binding protein [Candidatus Dormibacteraeota bacterium]